MRPPRIAILVLFCSASLFLVFRSIGSITRSHPSASSSSSSSSSRPPEKGQFRSLFSTKPFSLFPPSATISLTDDNSTFFAARPAAFGPPLAASGLSGQLWIGSGFTEDTLQDSEGEGELGCSDIPGWEGARLRLSIKAAEQKPAGGKPGPVAVEAKRLKTGDLEKDAPADRDAVPKERRHAQPKAAMDGTDDYLHQGFHQTRSPYNGKPTSSESSHSDIQSMQEAAEITGKVALLSRGGCGFLEKVKWAQRRGAIALIVGDNQKGGPLIQMFARGDVSNVTIPSVFTSRTTAHLLSSLMQSGGFIEDVLGKNGDPALNLQHSAKFRNAQGAKAGGVSARHASEAPTVRAPVQGQAEPESNSPAVAKRSWLSRLFHSGESRDDSAERSRPPSSGRLDWTSVDGRDSKKERPVSSGSGKAAKDGARGSVNGPEDGFQIGVQDWRDPDLTSPASPGNQGPAAQGSPDDTTQSGQSGVSAKEAGKVGNTSPVDVNGPKGGSITPGSGEYVPGTAGDSASSSAPGSSSDPERGLLSKIFGGDTDEDDESGHESGHASDRMEHSSATVSAPIPPGPGGKDAHHGLWVTITPASGGNPFFDTILVLIISPLITLTVVYALLILRVKIRMRRWRAPKSVVERLPVRTYHTVAPSPSQSPRTPSPASSSPTTPLLQGSPRSRPRSRTTPEPGELLSAVDALRTTAPRPEMNSRGGSQWKKYMGRQVECVVCLEEYVDGVSKVMSLPCGHEFHVECM